MICQIRPFAGQNTSKSQFEPPLPQAVDRTILFANPSSSDMQTSSFTRLRRLIKLGATKRILCSFEMIDRRFSDMQSRCHGEDRKSVVKGKSVSVRVALGGRRSIKKKKKE